LKKRKKKKKKKNFLKKKKKKKKNIVLKYKSYKYDLKTLLLIKFSNQNWVVVAVVLNSVGPLPMLILKFTQELVNLCRDAEIWKFRINNWVSSDN